LASARLRSRLVFGDNSRHARREPNDVKSQDTGLHHYLEKPMPPQKSSPGLPNEPPSSVVKEEHIEYGFIGNLPGQLFYSTRETRKRLVANLN